jgi:hypothetical protein
MTSTIKADVVTAQTTNGNVTLQGNGSGTVAIGDNTAITGTATVSSTLAVTGETTLTGGLASVGGNQIAGSKNMVINGAQSVSQRGSQVVTTGDSAYGVDRFVTRTYGGDGRFTIDAFQTDVPTTGGFKYSTRYTCSTVSTNTGTFGYGIEQRIEGFNCNRLMLGTAQAKPFTLSFWVKTSVAGTYTSAVRTASAEYSFVWEHTLSADTWTKVTKTIPALTSTLSSPQYTTSSMLLLSPISFGAKTSYNTTTLNAWQAGNYVFTTNQVHWMGTSGATCHITGVQCEEGSIATPFEHEDISTTLQKCQRYCFIAKPPTNTALGTGFARTTTTVHCVRDFPVTMRATPSLAFSSNTDFQVQYLGSTATTTAMAASELGPDTMAFQATVSSGLTAGQGMYVRDLNGGATITASAEL